MRQILLTAILLLGSNGFAAAQSTGSEGNFTIFNDTNNNILVGFYTNDGSGWSDNWLSDDVPPGASVSAEFYADSGACEQVFQAGWLGSDEETEVLDDPFDIDICEASSVYLGDNDITFD